MDPTAFVFMALSGEQELGPGAVIVDTARCHAKFYKLEDLEPANLRSQMSTQLEKDPHNLYILQKTPEHMHVFTYLRSRALDEIRCGTLPTLQNV